jgi:hypothetical protein
MRVPEPVSHELLHRLVAEDNRRLAMMRYITIPAPVTIPGMKKTDGSKVELNFFEYHEQNVWNSPEWRSSADMHKVFRELVVIFDEVSETEDNAGLVLEIPGRHYEIYLPLATGKGQQLAPRVARALAPHHAAIFEAPNKDPREKVVPEEEPKKADGKNDKKPVDDKKTPVAEATETN